MNSTPLTLCWFIVAILKNQNPKEFEYNNILFKNYPVLIMPINAMKKILTACNFH